MSDQAWIGERKATEVHLPDGILPPAVAVLGYAASAVASYVALRRVPDRVIPRLAVLAAGLFAVGSLHVRLGPASVHFLLTGLAAVIVGWRVIAPVTVSVALQALLLQHGGLTMIGVNACVMGLPAMLVGYMLRRGGAVCWTRRPEVWGALATVTCYVGSSTLFLLVAQLADRRVTFGLGVWLASYAPVMALEAVAAGAAVAFLERHDRGVFELCADGEPASPSGC